MIFNRGPQARKHVNNNLNRREGESRIRTDSWFGGRGLLVELIQVSLMAPRQEQAK